MMKDFFTASLNSKDNEIFDAIENELKRQQNQIELIASENIVSKAVLEAQGSILTNKYAEGYPNKRYYGGCEYVDIAENLAIERACKLFNCRFANVQPNSGSQANQAAIFSILSPGDVILGMSLDSGGHLTHGAKPNQSGKWFTPVQYGVTKDSNIIDYDQIRDLAKKHKPKLIIGGYSAYSRFPDYKLFREIADEVGAYFLFDMAHVAGLVAAGVHPSPFPYAHIITTTTHKTLRGPRGGMILTNDEDLAKKINSAIFPGIQGGPLMHVIAAKAVCFKEAMSIEFKNYAQQILDNAKALSKTIIENGCNIITGGTDNHLMLVDLRPKKVTGNIAEKALERAGITCNKNAIPFDPENPTVTSGIRIGTPACTTRGFREKEFEEIGKMICEVIESLTKGNNYDIEREVLEKIQTMCKKFPIY